MHITVSLFSMFQLNTWINHPFYLRVESCQIIELLEDLDIFGTGPLSCQAVG